MYIILSAVIPLFSMSESETSCRLCDSKHNHTLLHLAPSKSSPAEIGWDTESIYLNNNTMSFVGAARVLTSLLY